MTPLTSSPLKLFASLPPAEQDLLIQEAARKHNLSPDRLKAFLLRDWKFVGRPKQQPPVGAWRYWFLRCGRGFGKTLTAAQWVKARGLDEPGQRGALIAPTLRDARTTMVEGETGLLSILPAAALMGQSREIAWNRSTYELTLANGTLLTCFSSETPDRLRGPQHHFDWREEVSSWKDAGQEPTKEDSTWSNANLGTRLGTTPQSVITSTPKPNKLTRGILAIPTPRLRLVTGSSYENQENLSQQWWEEVVAPLEGTRTGRQEIEGELLDDVEGALWRRGQLELLRVTEAPPLRRIVVAVDPNASDSEASNAAGIIVVGLGTDQRGYVLEDRTVVRGGPAKWAQEAVDAFHDWEADRIVAEKNNGGEMVRMVMKTVDPGVPIKLVQAARGKRTRAEPVAALYEGGDSDNPDGPFDVEKARVRHVGSFPLLEDEMCEWTPDADSPDRMDALVWGLTELAIWRPAAREIRTSRPVGRIPRVGERFDRGHGIQGV